MMKRKHWVSAVPVCIWLAIVSFASGESKPPETTADPIRTVDFVPQLDGQEVTITFEVASIQHVAGEREGEFPTLIIHQVRADKSDRVVIYAKGDMADVLHRVDRASKDSLKGRKVSATGTVVVRDVLEDTGERSHLYELTLRDWKKFQVLRDERATDAK
jgi:hypothetical protein